MKDNVELEDYKDTSLVKSFDLIKGNEGKVPIRKTVMRQGKAFQQTYWVRPRDFAAYKSTESAAQLLTQAVEAQEYFEKALENLKLHNEKLGSDVFNKMKESNQSVLKLADKMVEISTWVGKRETSLGDFLNRLRQKMNSNGVGSADWEEVEKSYEEVSYKYENSGLLIRKEGDTKGSKIKVSASIVPENWYEKAGGVAKAIKDTMERSLARVQAVIGMREKGQIPESRTNLPAVKEHIKEAGEKVKKLKSEDKTSQSKEDKKRFLAAHAKEIEEAKKDQDKKVPFKPRPDLKNKKIETEKKVPFKPRPEGKEMPTSKRSLKTWEEAGFNAKEAANWEDKGYTPETAKRYVAEGKKSKVVEEKEKSVEKRGNKVNKIKELNNMLYGLTEGALRDVAESIGISKSKQKKLKISEVEDEVVKEAKKYDAIYVEVMRAIEQKR